MCLPVWREWKRIGVSPILAKVSVSKCAFPFEGNGNPIAMSISGDHTCLNVPSRLKGMETIIIKNFQWRTLFSLNVLSRLKGGVHLSSIALAMWVWMCFPVWRELKHYETRSRHDSNGLWIGFPVWREWKHARISIQVFIFKHFG